MARALEMIARVKPRILVINGGDGTVQSALTELYHGGHFEGEPPPVAVLPNGKTNLIALDLGMQGDPLEALSNIVEIARGDVSEHVVTRELIALSQASDNGRPVLGMFLGGAGLAETILYCRHKIYPLGLPNGLSHVLAAFAVLFSGLLGIRANFLPRRSNPVRISLLRDGELRGIFSVLIVTTLQKLLIAGNVDEGSGGKLKLMAVDQKPVPLFKAIFASFIGRANSVSANGIHIEREDAVRIDGGRSSVVLDGEVFEADNDHPITLKSTPPVPFVKIAG